MRSSSCERSNCARVQTEVKGDGLGQSSFKKETLSETHGAKRKRPASEQRRPSSPSRLREGQSWVRSVHEEEAARLDSQVKQRWNTSGCSSSAVKPESSTRTVWWPPTIELSVSLGGACERKRERLTASSTEKRLMRHAVPIKVEGRNDAGVDDNL